MIKEKSRGKWVLLLVALVFAFGGIPAVSQVQKAMDLQQKYETSLAYSAKAEKLVLQGDVQKARAEIEKCFAVSEKQDRAHFVLAQIYYHDGEFLQALAAIERAEADFRDIQELMASKNLENIKLIEAKKETLAETIQELMNEAVVQVCDQNELRQQAINLQEMINSLSNEQFNLVSGNARIPADYYFLHGNCYFKLRSHSDAEAQYMKALESDNKHGPTYNNLINLYFITGQAEKALSYLKTAEDNQVTVNAGLKKAVEDKAKSGS